MFAFLSANINEPFVQRARQRGAGTANMSYSDAVGEESSNDGKHFILSCFCWTAGLLFQAGNFIIISS